MITVSFDAPTKHARKVQDLVKTYGGYFDNNEFPKVGGGLALNWTQFKITFEGAAQDQYGQFMIRVDIIKQQYF